MKTLIKKQQFVIKLQVAVITLMLFFMIGMNCNFFVIKENGGKMPVYIPAELNYEFETDEHFSYSENDEVVKAYLSDKYYYGESIYSLGDLLMTFFMLIIVLLLLVFIYRIKEIYSHPFLQGRSVRVRNESPFTSYKSEQRT